MGIQFGFREMAFLTICPLMAATTHYLFLSMMHLV
jgi:hypothetical protein